VNWRGTLRAAPPPLGAAPAFAARPTGPVRRATRSPASTVEFAWADRAIHTVRHHVTRHRKLLAAVCAGLSVMVMAPMVSGQHTAGVAVVTAARDLTSGVTLTAADLTTITLPASAVPAGAVTSAAAAIGQPVAGAMRRGEPLTDARLDHGPLSAPAPGLVAAPVRLADAQAAGLLRAGEHVDVLASSTSVSTSALASATTADQPDVTPSAAAVVAADVTVVAIPSAPAGPGAAADPAFEGALVVLATTPDQARRLAQAEVSARLSAIVVG